MTNTNITKKEGPTEINGIPTCRECKYFIIDRYYGDRRICELSYQINDINKDKFSPYQLINIRDKKIDSIL